MIIKFNYWEWMFISTTDRPATENLSTLLLFAPKRQTGPLATEDGQGPAGRGWRMSTMDRGQLRGHSER